MEWILVGLLGLAAGGITAIWQRGIIAEIRADRDKQKRDAELLRVEMKQQRADYESRLAQSKDATERLSLVLANTRRDLEGAEDALSKCDDPDARREHLRAIGRGLLQTVPKP